LGIEWEGVVKDDGFGWDDEVVFRLTERGEEREKS
jgi:hypothetical protein